MNNSEKKQSLALAEHYFRSNNYQFAEHILNAIIKLDPNNSKANELLAYIYGNKGKFNIAFELLEKSCSKDDCSPEALYYLGSSQLKLNQYEKAAQSFKQSIEKAGVFFEALHDLATTYGHLGKTKEALSYYIDCLKINQNSYELHFNIARTLDHLKRYDEALSHYDQAIQLNPNYAEAWSNKGVTLHDLKRYDEALSHFDQAIQLNPNFAEAWSNKGNTLKDLKRYDEALSHFDQAIQLNPNYAEAWSNKGVTLQDLKRYDEALSHFDQAIQLNPNYAEAWSNKGVTLQDLKRYDEALSHFDQAIQLRADFFDSYWNKSLALLTLGNFKDGWGLYTYRWKRTNADKYRYSNINKLESLDNLTNKNILVWYEQGYGDTIQFSRYIPKLIDLGANVTFEVQKPLSRIFTEQKKLVVTSEIKNHSNFDFQLPLLSLPKLFNSDIGSIPNPLPIQIKSEDISIWKKKLNLSDRKLNIGLAISGNRNHKNDSNRSMRIDDISPLLDVGEFFLLQKEINQFDLDNLNKKMNLNFLGKQIDDFLDTASIIMNMDLIISVDTSLIHLAGSLNKQSYLMLPWCPEWRWLLDRPDSPWYPSVKIFRQKYFGDWNSVIEDIKYELSILTQ
jgi:tetratricopeptide (TPR) repeat protein